MPLRGDILEPIAGANPAGVHLRYEAIFSEIKAARRSDDDGARRPEDPPPKAADWPKVVELTSNALATQSKDLELAGWLTEALLRREGLPGLKSGLELIRELIVRYWPSLFPPLADGEPEPAGDRSARLSWVGQAIVPAVQDLALNRKGHSLIKYREARAVGSEADCGGNEKKLEARQTKIDEGKMALEEFERAVDETPKNWFKGFLAELKDAAAAVAALEAMARQHIADDPPSFSPLRDALADIERVGQQMLARKLEQDPDPVDVSAAKGGGVGEELGTSAEGAAVPVEPGSADDAWTQLAVLARYLRQQSPVNPGPYLMLRGLRWGELRAANGEVDPRVLVAPPTRVRAQIKTLLLDAKWKELLETCEAVMARPDGRGWLDLQRYAVTACDNLGGEYEAVGRAIRGELALLLHDVPGLPDMALMDDTATANVETRQWLRSENLIRVTEESADGAEGGSATAEPPRPTVGEPRVLYDAVFERAKEAIREGQVKRAIGILNSEVSRERSQRARFIRRLQVASIMMDSGHESMARPILEEILTQLDAHQLEQWEAGELMAQPLTLLFRCLAKLDMESERRQEIYLRIVRLDPVQAMNLQP